MYVLLKLAAVFAIIVLLLSRKVKLGYVMLIASAALGLLFQASVRDIIKELFKTIAEWETISLILLLSLIMILEKMMSRKELMSKMVSALRHTVGDYRLTSLLLPALIGLLPSAGGAIFSAPMVNEVCHDTELSAEKKALSTIGTGIFGRWCFPSTLR